MKESLQIRPLASMFQMRLTGNEGTPLLPWWTDHSGVVSITGCDMLHVERF